MKPGYVYLIEREGDLVVKIGRGNDPSQSLVHLQTGSPERLYLVHWILTNDMVWLEKLFHQVFAKERMRGDGEWFSLEDGQKKEMQNIQVLDHIPLSVFYKLPEHEIHDRYFCSEAGQVEFADRSQTQLVQMLTEAGWTLEKHEDVYISWEKLSEPEQEEILSGRDTHGLVIAKRQANVVCTAAFLYSEALRKVAARAKQAGLL